VHCICDNVMKRKIEGFFNKSFQKKTFNCETIEFKVFPNFAKHLGRK
jgi:hypothetical protein